MIVNAYGNARRMSSSSDTRCTAYSPVGGAKSRTTSAVDRSPSFLIAARRRTETQDGDTPSE
jgi:hypothetical protein